MNPFKKSLSGKTITALEYFLIILTAVVPLFFNHPYRLNLFLAWEGAFRLSIGQIPYRDFGSPVGYGFWILPAIFFKVFGPHVFTLLIFQSSVNIAAGLIFRSLLKVFQVQPGVRFISILVFCMSYSMINLWPWYNHLVVIFEMAGLLLIVREIVKPFAGRSVFLVAAGTFLLALSFLTKQDTGLLGFGAALLICLLDAYLEKRIKTVIWFVGGYVVSMAILIVPFLPYEFSYWFNLGQFPHNSRVDKYDIVNEFIGGSHTIKLYLLFIGIALFLWFHEKADWKSDKNFLIFSLFTLLMLGQAAIIQVTSYTPADGNIYYHSFAFAFLGFFFLRNFNMQQVLPFVVLTGLTALWWSGITWTRFLRAKVEPILAKKAESTDNSISKRTFLITRDTMNTDRSKWIVPQGVESFRRIRVPKGTAEGIKRLADLPELRNPGARVLNMSELTPLMYDLKWQIETGPDYPLWFHKGVSFFDREVEMFCEKVSRGEYDVILFEDIPDVNQFYPYQVRDCIQENYRMKFKFRAPRIPEISYIEVYTKE